MTKSKQEEQIYKIVINPDLASMWSQECWGNDGTEKDARKLTRRILRPLSQAHKQGYEEAVRNINKLIAPRYKITHDTAGEYEMLGFSDAKIESIRLKEGDEG